MSIKVYKITSNGSLPSKIRPGDAGYDLYASEDITIYLGETKLISTGIAVNVPGGTYGQIADRSSMASKGLIVGAGVIDEGYNGEVKVVMHNFSAVNYIDPVLFRESYQIKKGDKIAQLLVLPVHNNLEVETVNTLWESGRGSLGFGSSDVKKV